MRYWVVPLALGLLISASALAQLPTLKDTASGVTVAVTPGNLGPDTNVWDFTIAFDTHSQDLSDDLVSSAVLVDGEGHQFKALAWEGAQPGGHHRSGVLKFRALSPRPPSIELRLQRPGEAKPRTFRWKLM